jgi:hypothetical protein
MQTTEFRIGNLIEQGTIVSITENGVFVKEQELPIKSEDIKPILLTEKWLKRFGFKSIDSDMYINGKEWTLNVDDGIFFDGIGTRTFKTDGSMTVNFVCGGYYICNSVGTVHDLQNKGFFIADKELKLKKVKKKSDDLNISWSKEKLKDAPFVFFVKNS